jgi:TonB family protein
MSMAAEFVVKSTVILAVGLLAASRLSRASASLRHFVLGCTLLAVVLVVPLGMVAPAWSLQLSRPPAVGTDAAGVVHTTETSAAKETTGLHGPIRAVPWPSVLLATWVAGSVAAGLGLGGGLARLLRARRRAVRIDDRRWLTLTAAVAKRYGIRRRIQLLTAADNTPPATWGLVRPSVMLPHAAAQWDDDRAEAVLAHELAHVARGDWATQLAAELTRAALWWHPLMWVLASRLRRESELACDDRVLNSRVHAADYAAHLLAIARTCRVGPLSALPMARLSTLERRIAAMLAPDLDRSHPSTATLATIGALCLLATAAVSGATRAQTSPLPLVGTVYDPTGAVVPEVSLTLTAADGTAARTTTDGAGRFQFPVTPPGRFELEASLPGFRALTTPIELRSAADWDRTITLQVGTVRETIVVSASQLPPSSAVATGRSAAVRVGGNIRAPRKLKHVSPVYPETMRAAGVEGTVPLEAIITASGTVQSVRLLSATVHPELALAAVDAVRQWRFEPTLLNGSPVDIAMSTTVTFTLAR